MCFCAIIKGTFVTVSSIITFTTNTTCTAAVASNTTCTITTGFGAALEASLAGWQTGKVHFISLLVVMDNRGVYRLG